MGRSIIAVIVSYITMFVLNFLGFVGLYLLVGQDNAFKPRSYLASNRWIAMTFVIIFITAIIAGLICAAIAKGGRATLALAIVVLALAFLGNSFSNKASKQCQSRSGWKCLFSGCRAISALAGLGALRLSGHQCRRCVDWR